MPGPQTPRSRMHASPPGISRHSAESETITGLLREAFFAGWVSLDYLVERYLTAEGAR